MPLWQLMHDVPAGIGPCIAATALAVCLLASIAANEWQLWQPIELLPAISAHTERAISSRWAANFSGVSITPVTWPIRSWVAPIMWMTRAINGFGTWQSAHSALTPTRFV